MKPAGAINGANKSNVKDDIELPIGIDKGGVPDIYFIFEKSISCNNLVKTWDRSLEFGIRYLDYI